MRLHKTKYSWMSNNELMQEADRQGFSMSEIGRELLARIEGTPNEERPDAEFLDRQQSLA